MATGKTSTWQATAGVIQDTWLDSSNPTLLFDPLAMVRTGKIVSRGSNINRSVMRANLFDATAGGDGPLGSRSTVTSATLTVNVTSIVGTPASPATLSVHKIRQAMEFDVGTPNSPTWNKYFGINAWNTAGANDNTDIWISDPGDVLAFVIPLPTTTGIYKIYDSGLNIFTNIVQDAIDNEAGIFKLYMKLTTEDSSPTGSNIYFDFTSADASSGIRPLLTINWEAFEIDDSETDTLTLSDSVETNIQQANISDTLSFTEVSHNPEPLAHIEHTVVFHQSGLFTIEASLSDTITFTDEISEPVENTITFTDSVVGVAVEGVIQYTAFYDHTEGYVDSGLTQSVTNTLLLTDKLPPTAKITQTLTLTDLIETNFEYSSDHFTFSDSVTVTKTSNQVFVETINFIQDASDTIALSVSNTLTLTDIANDALEQDLILSDVLSGNASKPSLSSLILTDTVSTSGSIYNIVASNSLTLGQSNAVALLGTVNPFGSADVIIFKNGANVLVTLPAPILGNNESINYRFAETRSVTGTIRRFRDSQME